MFSHHIAILLLVLIKVYIETRRRALEAGGRDVNSFSPSARPALKTPRELRVLMLVQHGLHSMRNNLVDLLGSREGVSYKDGARSPRLTH